MNITKHANPIKTINIISGIIFNLFLSTLYIGLIKRINPSNATATNPVIIRDFTTVSISWKNILIEFHQSLRKLPKKFVNKLIYPP